MNLLLPQGIHTAAHVDVDPLEPVTLEVEEVAIAQVGLGSFVGRDILDAELRSAALPFDIHHVPEISVQDPRVPLEEALEHLLDAGVSPYVRGEGRLYGKDRVGAE